ncbi:efflux RND transporter permease subunit [Pseudobacteriovorax antillogorgiicola]|uniref:Multidrug efflux pump subunit AcrB n=1 Tax=Pseudobacteriovorax antillogorgiicola TaxID=1513793 RepID=A0A1Y6CDZ3_9BACT|nr:efflux RND transporter permease subunit [Pseudobacteriovorax antillogorgiicola]TCS47912.1 multidrug efflux pump subunit AcrB [Pseudobacteriovorax antillogorgiicola]SMF57854.1 Multidrug efflux pump subunit AcrB [Pseudobacteriovorax antillogorgiicola]
MQSLLSYFSQNHRLTNLLFGLVLLGGILSWFHIKKEEMPEFESNSIRISASYPGANAADVERLVIFEIEKRLRGLSGIETISSEAGTGSASISVSLLNNLDDKQVVLQSIREAALDAPLPDRVRETISFRQFKTSEKAIMDISLSHSEAHLLNFEDRRMVQDQARSLENMLVASPLISSVSQRGFLEQEIQILVEPTKLEQFEIPISQIAASIRNNNIRLPAGALEDTGETKVTIQSELDQVEKFENLTVSSNFGGRNIRLKDVAKVLRIFQKTRSIQKVNGHEAVIINIRKSVDADITEAQEAVLKILDQFKQSRKNAKLKIIALDDESYVISNRLKIIASNGIVGFLLILICLLLFLDLRSGIWVAMGIPFSLCFTLIISNYLGFTVNNVTLAAVIIVLGIVVDDAIIVAENVSRKKSLGLSELDASVEGTKQVMLPIIASILTTCVAFVPFYFFEGRFSSFVLYIPSIVIIMLMGSLLESTLILPSHLQGWKLKEQKEAGHWFFKFEERFAKLLKIVLRFRAIYVLVFIGILAGSVYIFQNKLKFVLFPQDENSEIFIRATAKDAQNAIETAELSRKIESMVLQDEGLVVGIRSSIGQSRRGRQSLANSISYRIELTAKEERAESSESISDRWATKLKEMTEFTKARVIKGRFGFSSGSPLEIMIQSNRDGERHEIAQLVKAELDKIEGVHNSEIEAPLLEDTYEIDFRKDRMAQLNLDPKTIAESIRIFVEGQILYTLPEGDQEIEVRLTNSVDSRKKIEQLLEKHIGNSAGYLVPLREVIEVKKLQKPASISRVDYQRTTMVYGDLKPGSKLTSLEVAEMLESGPFPRILEEHPNSIITFRGEVEESRKSSSGFSTSILMAVVMIYTILILLFNSFTTPFLILAAIPFGIAGVILAFFFHQKASFGFFAVVGAIGMSGVVINDSIVLISTFKENLSWQLDGLFDDIARISSTRLRAVLVTTITTVAGLFPTAYGLGGYDAMLAEMMLAMGWGLLFGTTITLGLVPVLFSFYASIRIRLSRS